MNDDLDTKSLHDLVARHRAGDRAALDGLVRRTADRLARVARKMLRGFPAVRAREETGDVLQSALLRLTRALRQVTPASVRDYYRLAAEQIRRELLDLARRYRRRPAGQLGDADPAEPASASPDDLGRWAALHEAVERLPTDEREVFCLTFYHGWTQPQIAELLQMSDRQVRRVWAAACLRLNQAVGGLPEV
jgi:RNA polymerase sigma-70 factor (ECF subfamily)